MECRVKVLGLDFPWPKDNVVSKDQLMESAQNKQKKSGAFNGNNKMMYLFFILGKSPSNFFVKILFINIATWRSRISD